MYYRFDINIEKNIESYQASHESQTNIFRAIFLCNEKICPQNAKKFTAETSGDGFELTSQVRLPTSSFF